MLQYETWLLENDYGKVVQVSPITGGCINQVLHITTDRHFQFCLKTNPSAPKHFFHAEKTGLETLAAVDSVRTPSIVYVSDTFILLEYIEPAKKCVSYWENLANQLAHCHSKQQSHFGFIKNNFCGATPQINSLIQNGHDFFASNRLIPQAKWAYDKGMLSRKLIAKIESLCNKLTELIPEQLPGILHGDLWSGNIHTDRHGKPVLIDPACYWGWPESDIAMTTLFGGFPQQFYEHYTSALPMEDNWQERLPIYNLYHQLNHLNLFGESYLPGIKSCLDQFA